MKTRTGTDSNDFEYLLIPPRGRKGEREYRI